MVFSITYFVPKFTLKNIMEEKELNNIYAIHEEMKILKTMIFIAKGSTSSMQIKFTFSFKINLEVAVDSLKDAGFLNVKHKKNKIICKKFYNGQKIEVICHARN